MKKQKTPFILKNSLKRKRYLVRSGSLHFASVLHAAQYFGIRPSSIYKDIKTFLQEGNKINARPKVTKTFEYKGIKLTITIHNLEYPHLKH